MQPEYDEMSQSQKQDSENILDQFQGNQNSRQATVEMFDSTPIIENDNQIFKVFTNKSAIFDQTRQPQKQRLLEEIHIKELDECQNLVYTSQNNLQPKQQGSSLLRKEWTQIFDLENTILICKVQGSILEMHLLHFNQQPKQKYQFSQLNGGIFESRNQKKNEYQIPLENEKFQSAQFIFEGNIAPNIHLLTNNANQNNELKGKYILTLATTLNQFYNIEFSPYILKKEESLRVYGPFEIVIDQQYNKIDLTNSVLKTFEIAIDPETLTYIHLYGLGLSINHHQDVLQDIGQTLHINYQQNSSVSLSQQRLQKSVFKNIVGNVKSLGDKANKLTSILGQNLMQSIFQKNEQQDIITEQEEEGDYIFQNDEPMDYNQQLKIKQAKPYAIIGNEEGVIQIKYISSYSLICAVFSNGSFILRPVSSYHEIQNNDCKFLVQHNLIQISKLYENNNCFQFCDDFRITDAKICYLAVQEQDNNQKKEHLKLAIAYEIQETDSKKIWRVVEFKIHLRLFSKKNSDRQNYYELIPQEINNQSVEIIDYEQIMETYNINCKISHIQMDPIAMGRENQKDQIQYSILINVWNQKANEGFIKDIKNNTQVFDSQNNETLNQIQDCLSLQQEKNINFQSHNQIHQNMKKEEENDFKEQIISNIMKLNRFQPGLIAQFLKDNVEWKMSSELSVEQQLEIVLNRLPNQDLVSFQDRLYIFKKKCSKLLALELSPILNNMSLQAQRKQLQFYQQTNQIQKLGAQFIFRNQIGISILKEVEEPQEFFYGVPQLSIELKFQKIKMNLILKNYQKSTFLDQIIENLEKELVGDLNLAIGNQIVIALSLYDLYNEILQKSNQKELQIQSGIGMTIYNILQKFIQNHYEAIIKQFNYLKNELNNNHQNQVENLSEENQSYANNIMIDVLEKYMLKKIENLLQILDIVISFQEFLRQQTGEQIQNEIEQQLNLRQMQLKSVYLIFKKQIIQTKYLIKAIGQSQHVQVSVLHQILTENNKLYQFDNQNIELVAVNILSQFWWRTQNAFDYQNIAIFLLQYLDNKIFDQKQNSNFYLRAMIEYLNSYQNQCGLRIQSDQLRASSSLIQFYESYAVFLINDQELLDFHINSNPNILNHQQDKMEIFQIHIDKFITTLFDSNFFDSIDHSFFLDTLLEQQQDQFINSICENAPKFKIVLWIHNHFMKRGLNLQSIYLLRKSLNQLIGSNNTALKDEINCRIFNSCSILDEQSISIKFDACTSISETSIDSHVQNQFQSHPTTLRQKYIKLFFDQMVLSKNLKYLEKYQLNVKKDQTFLIENTLKKIDSMAHHFSCNQSQAKNPQNLAQKLLQESTPENILNCSKDEIIFQIQVLYTIIQIYENSSNVDSPWTSKNKRLRKIVSFLWDFNQKIEKIVRFDLKNKFDLFESYQKNQDFFRNAKDDGANIIAAIQQYEQYLYDISDIFYQIQRFALDNILRIYQILGDNFYLIINHQTQQDIYQRKNSSKRTLQGSIQKIKVFDEADSQLNSQRSIFDLYENDQKYILAINENFHLNQKEFKKIYKKDVLISLNLSKARITLNKRKLRAETNYTLKQDLANNDFSNEFCESQIEEEVKFEYENACFLLAEIGKFDQALELGQLLNLSESIGYCISKMIEVIKIENEQMNQEFEWNDYEFGDNEKIERTIEPIISQLSSSQALATAKYLITLKEELPQCLCDKLIDDHMSPQIIQNLVSKDSQESLNSDILTISRLFVNQPDILVQQIFQQNCILHFHLNQKIQTIQLQLNQMIKQFEQQVESNKNVFKNDRQNQIYANKIFQDQFGKIDLDQEFLRHDSYIQLSKQIEKHKLNLKIAEEVSLKIQFLDQ